LCRASNGTSSYTLDEAQGANATTIAAVGKRVGLADHAVTIALAAALQESKLHNVSHGDLDSLGLFQQRPSQGWGTPAQILQPTYAAEAFYARLSKVDGWQALSVTSAAQAVQHSAAPDAYAGWEPEARVLAEALTGEVAAGFSCRTSFDPSPSVAADRSALTGAMVRELGVNGLGTRVSGQQGWTVTSWLVGHARAYRVASVSFAGRTWTAAVGVWRVDPGAGAQLQADVR
jgi:hypothetical protein